jgi:cell shape-determining protein MreC
VDKGEKDGPRHGRAVAGWWGEVIEAFPNTAKILLITDPNSGVTDCSARELELWKAGSRNSHLKIRESDDVQVGNRSLPPVWRHFPKGLLTER